MGLDPGVAKNVGRRDPGTRKDIMRRRKRHLKEDLAFAISSAECEADRRLLAKMKTKCARIVITKHAMNWYVGAGKR